MEFWIFLAIAALLIPIVISLIFPQKVRRPKPRNYYRNMGGRSDVRDDRHIPW